LLSEYRLAEGVDHFLWLNRPGLPGGSAMIESLDRGWAGIVLKPRQPRTSAVLALLGRDMPRLRRHSHIAGLRYVSMTGGATAGTSDRDPRSTRYYTNHLACALGSVGTQRTTFVEARVGSVEPSLRIPIPLVLVSSIQVSRSSASTSSTGRVGQA
jgi:hypothetical protein